MYFAAAMAGLGALGSLMGNSKANKNLYQQQLAIVGGQKSRNVQLVDKMDETIRAGGIAKTKVEREELRATAKQIASRATSGTAGQSALYAYMNIGQQSAFTTGTIQAKVDGSLREDGRVSQKYDNQARSQINSAESKNKSGTEMFMEAAIAGASAYSGAGDFAKAAQSGPAWLNTATSW
jgi:hypothetical protein